MIAGAGPAGMSAALILGRACRRVLLCDTGTPRSWASKAMHAFLTREGISPQQFRRLARSELRTLRTVRFVPQAVKSASRATDKGFRVKVGNGRTVTCRKLLVATGLFDHIPELPGIARMFGHSVFQCPYCDGWEFRRRPLAIYGKGQRGFEMARALTAWSADLVLCTDGPSRLSAVARQHLERNGIRMIEERIARLVGAGGRLRSIEFAGGRRVPREALFFDMPCMNQSRLAESLGCEFTREGRIRCGRYEATTVPGLYVAGNIIRDVQLSIVAAAEGARAAFGINRALTREDFAAKATGTQRIEHLGPGDESKEIRRR